MTDQELKSVSISICRISMKQIAPQKCQSEKKMAAIYLDWTDKKLNSYSSTSCAITHKTQTIKSLNLSHPQVGYTIRAWLTDMRFLYCAYMPLLLFYVY